MLVPLPLGADLEREYRRPQFTVTKAEAQLSCWRGSTSRGRVQALGQTASTWRS